MSWTDLVKLLTTETTPVCKGLVYSGYNKQFKTKRGFGQKIELRFLKRSSCSGCLDCFGLSESIDMQMEMGIEFIGFDKIENDKFYTFRFTNMQRDWESGIIDYYDVEIIEIKGNEDGDGE